jgi:IS5 family transposase
VAITNGMRLRQSYLRIAKRAAMMAGRYAHAKGFNRHRRELRILRNRLGRLIRDTAERSRHHPVHLDQMNAVVSGTNLMDTAWKILR